MNAALVLACARNGLVAMLLGGYDGAASWSLALDNLRSPDEQLMVETHEGLHHELQASTSYGLIAAMASQLAGRGVRRYALREVFQDLVDRARQVHEIFATTLSAYVTGIDRAQQLLADSPDYSGYLAAGLDLGGTKVPDRLQGTAAAAVLRCCMAPAMVTEVIADGFAALHRGRVTDPDFAPDVRLARFRDIHSARAWGKFFHDLTGHDDPLVPEADVMRECYEYTRRILDRVGLPSVAWAEQVHVVEALREAVAAVDADLAQRLNIVTERRPVLDDGLEYDRQKIVLRERLPAQILETVTLDQLEAPFVIPLADGRAGVCGMWLDRRVAAKQYLLPVDTPLPDLIVALVGVSRVEGGQAVVRLGLFPSHLTPREVQDRRGPVPLVAVTTHLSLFDPTVDARLRRTSLIFVLMDLPVAWHVGDWIRQGATVRMALVPLEGLADVEVWLAAFTVDLRPGYRFLSIGGKVGVSVLVERLRQRYGESLMIDGEFLRQDAAAINAALTRVFSTWHVLDQDAVE